MLINAATELLSLGIDWGSPLTATGAAISALQWMQAWQGSSSVIVENPILSEMTGKLQTRKTVQ